MPPIPSACQALAADVAASETQEQTQRAQLSGLSGQAAWVALTQLGSLRLDLAKKRTALDECVQRNSAALQADIVVMDCTRTFDERESRVARLWEMDPHATGARDTTAVNANSFAFQGPLPSAFGLSVVRTGDSETSGPDFRSLPLSATDAAGSTPLRLEVVLGPMVVLESADIVRLFTDSFTLSSARVEIPGGQVHDVSLTGLMVSLGRGELVARVNGSVVITNFTAPSSTLPFAATITIHLVPTAKPDPNAVFDVVLASNVNIEAPGIAGALLQLMQPAMQDFMSQQLRPLIRSVFRSAVETSVLRAFVLQTLPPGTSLSVRSLVVDGQGIRFQPALGAIGTGLSTFAPPSLPPP